MKMRNIFKALALALLLPAYANATIEEDITQQGVIGYIAKSVTAPMLATTLRNYGTLTAATTLTYANCGMIYFLNSATEFETTLPTPVAGCYLKFIVKAAPSGASYTVVTASSANILIGGINELEVDTNDDGPYDADGDTLTFVNSVGVVGDYVELFSDGTSWYIQGQANADGGLTVTKAS